MSVLALLIDSDVLLDFLIDREPFSGNAKELVQKARAVFWAKEVEPYPVDAGRVRREHFYSMI
jgi:hypothetical protein